MGTIEIQKKVRIVRASGGRGKEAILPYAVYRDLLELKMTMEIYRRTDVQQSIKRGRKDITEGKVMPFRKASEALRWLKK